MRKLSRRDLLKLAGGLVLTASLPVSRPAAGRVLDRFFGIRARLTPGITPNEDFYVTSHQGPPTIRIKTWTLAIKGLVERPLTLTYDELLARPTVSEIVTLECIGNEVGGDAISTAKWEGPSLKALLEEVGPSAKAYDVVFRAADGYSDSLPVARALAGDVLIAHRMNGVPLPLNHGFPARIIVPGVYGMKHVQWLTGIELVEQDYRGYYQKKGWSEEAVVKIMSRIDLPGHGGTIQGHDYVVRGLAFAGTRGIRQVEVSTDGGETWNPASLDMPLSPFAWRFWNYRWQIPGPGRYTLVVRATDGTGLVQDPSEQPPAPDGAAGLHEVTVKVET